MPVSRLSILRQWLLPTITMTDSKTKQKRYPLLIGLRSCPYSEALSEDLRRQSKLPVREVWVSSRTDPLFQVLKKEYKQPTYPMLIATPILPPVQEAPPLSRSKGDIKLGGYSDFQDLLSKLSNLRPK